MKPDPFFSVIIPTYSSPAARLNACLKSLACQHYAADRFEVIVVEDGGHADQEAAQRSLADKPRVTWLTQDHAGPATARNRGAAHASGNCLAFTDDDCMPRPNWLQTLAGQLTAFPDRLIGGRTVNGLPGNLYSTASQLLVTYLYAYYNHGPDGPCFFTSNNMAVHAKQFHAAGGFDTGFRRAGGEDRALCDTWRRLGYAMSYAPEAVVAHAHALTFRSFFEQQMNYGRGAWHFRRARAARSGSRVRLEPPGFYARLVRFPFRREPAVRAWRLAGLLALSQIANAAGFCLERRADAAT